MSSSSPPVPNQPHSPVDANFTAASRNSQDPARRSSFNFLRRQKSTEGPGRGMLSRKSKGYQYPTSQSVPRVPPQIPTPASLTTMDPSSFIGENARQQYGSSKSPAYATQSSLHHPTSPPYDVPIPPMPHSATSANYPKGENGVDPYTRTESMTHRGRYSYASSAISTGTAINSPRRVRRRKDPTPFNILVIGAQNSGKTSFIEFLRSSLVSKSSMKRDHTPPATALPVDSPFTPHYLETQIDHERIGVTLWDSHGLEKKFVDLQLREMSSFLENKFEDTFNEEQKVIRAPGVRDTHVHCVFLILDPARLDSNLSKARRQNKSTSQRFEEPLRLTGVLDQDLDIQVLKTLQGKTTVIPVISKADTITTGHMNQLKQAVWTSLKQAKLDPLEALQLGDDDSDVDRFDEREEEQHVHEDELEDENDLDVKEIINRPDSEIDPGAQARAQQHRRSPSGLSMRLSQAVGEGSNEVPYLPMSIISPDSYDPGVIGRRFPWGFADPYNEEHCDFVRLKESVFSEWRAELREASREIWYEGWRTSRLNRRGTPSSSVANGANGNGIGLNGRSVSHGTVASAADLANTPYGGGAVGSAVSMPPPPGSAYGGLPSRAGTAPQSPQSVQQQESFKGAYAQGATAF